MLHLPADMVIECEDLLHRSRLAQDSGFTLIEVMLVVAVLAAIAGGAILALTGTKEEVDIQLAHSEMMAIKQAILKFKQDTGYLPNQGPFRLKSDGGELPDGEATPSNNLPSYVPSGVANKRAWLLSPANFWLLYGRDGACPRPSTEPRSPLCGTGHQLEQWNRDIRRGWRGPYLTRFGEGFVDVGDEINPDKSGPNGSPTSGTILQDVLGVADPFVFAPFTNLTNPPLVVEPNSYLKWRGYTTTSYLGELHCDPKKTLPECRDYDRYGRPYLLFDPGTQEARIVSMGLNGRFDGVNASNPCAPPNGTDKDDIVLCILK